MSMHAEPTGILTFRFQPRFALQILLVCAIVIGFPGNSAGQETSGALEGRILDPAGEPISEAEITLTSPALQGIRGTASLESGFFRFPVLPVGRYTVTVAHPLHRTVTFEEVRVRLGQTASLGQIQLERAIQQMEPIVVRARRAVDPLSTYMGYNLFSEEFENLPIDRDYSTMATLLPNVNTGYLGDPFGNGVEFNGSTDFENNYFIEGVDVTEPYWGAGAMPLPYNFVREVQVRSGAYEAEYRSALGGVVDVITHSGSNELQGEVFGHYLDNSLTGSPRLSLGEPPSGDFSQYDFGFGLGGPLKRDKLWLYGALDVSRVTEDATIPSLETRTDETTAYRFAGKLNWRVNEQNDLILSVIGAPSKRDMVWTWAEQIFTPVTVTDADVYLMDQKFQNFVFSLEGKHFLKDNLSLESTASLFKHKYEEIPTDESGTGEPMFVDLETGTWSGGYISSLVNDYRTGAVGAKATLVTDNHTWKAGLEYRESVGSQYGAGGFILRTLEADSSESFLWWQFDGGGSDIPTKNRFPSVFVQDSWRLGQRLRLNLGLRWDGQYIIDSNGDVAHKILDQWQPRTGFTYLFGENSDRKIYGSYGRFYQELGVLVADALFRAAGFFRTTAYDHDPREDPTGGVVVDEWISKIGEELDDFSGQHFDEFTLGYEHNLGTYGTAGARGIYRTLRRGIEDAYDPDTGERLFGNPGFGELSDFPKMRREYTALELTYRVSVRNRLGLLASYVLSRNYGNYPGLYATDHQQAFPNLTGDFDLIESTVNSTGLLPNDRPHVVKLSGWYRTNLGLMAGASASWMSGTPLNEFGAASVFDPGLPLFLVPRGEAGRSPSIWDLNFRFSYDIPLGSSTSVRPRLVLDLLHVGSPRKAVMFDQKHYLGVDEEGNQINESPTYGLALRHQPPMAVRLGMQMEF